MESPAASPAAVVRAQLAQYMGPFTARNAVQLGAKNAFGIDMERLTREQVPALLEVLGPTLRTLLGKEGALKVVAQIKRELGIE
jgi:hypothetical protein